MTQKLPTTPGAVIGWSIYYDGPRYGCAVLNYSAGNDGKLVWYRSGLPTKTPTQMKLMMRKVPWQYMGQIEPATLS